MGPFTGHGESVIPEGIFNPCGLLFNYGQHFLRVNGGRARAGTGTRNNHFFMIFPYYYPFVAIIIYGRISLRGCRQRLVHPIIHIQNSIDFICCH